MQQEREDELTGGGSTTVVRRGNVVFRESRPWSPTVLALLRHLEREGFAAAPRVVEPGFDPDGREMLTFMAGESPHPSPWSEEGAAGVGRMLRQAHRSAATFSPPSDAVWMPWWGRDLPAARLTIGHCAAEPWNILALDGLPVALIDWDTAGPVGAEWDLAQTAWMNAHLHDDDVAEREGLPALADRARQLRAIAEGYGLVRKNRRLLVDQMIEVAIRSAAQEAIDAGVGPDSTDPAAMSRLGGGTPATGHELLWGMTWRTRSAGWMLKHRATLERALE